MRPCILPLLALMLAACTSLPRPIPVSSTTTTVGRAGEQPADPAIWSGFGDAAFVAAASRTGLIIHDLEGEAIQRAAGPELTDIDVVGLPLENGRAVVVGGTERAGSLTRIALYRLDWDAAQVARRWGEFPTDLSAPRGLCMRQLNGVVHVVVVDRRGEVRQYTLAEGPGEEPVLREVRRLRLTNAGPGCAIDPHGGRVYFSHARGGFWRYDLNSRTGETAPVRLTDQSGRALPRSRDVAFLTDFGNRYLVSLDNDSAAFSVWRIERDALTWLGRFEVRPPGSRAVRGQAGVDAYGAEIGPFGHGLVVVHDQSTPDTLKYVDWSAVRQALGF